MTVDRGGQLAEHLARAFPHQHRHTQLTGQLGAFGIGEHRHRTTLDGGAGEPRAVRLGAGQPGEQITGDDRVRTLFDTGDHQAGRQVRAQLGAGQIQQVGQRRRRRLGRS